nr:hypothetical protein [uncultured Flavobacterium sp.]
MKKILIYTILFIYPYLNIHSQSTSSIDTYYKKAQNLENKLLKETGTKSIEELKEKSKSTGNDINKLIAAKARYAPLIDKYAEASKKLEEQYLDVLNINNIIFSRLQKKYKKDEFETTENYKQRISQFKKIADSIIVVSICEYIDAKSIIKVKYLNYDADNQIYNVEILLGYSSYGSNNSYFDSKTYDITTKINSKFKISSEKARKIKDNPIENLNINTSYENWSDENGLLMPITNYKISDNNASRPINHGDDNEVENTNEYEAVSFSTPVKDIIFSYKIKDGEKIIFNFSEYCRNKKTENK